MSELPTTRAPYRQTLRRVGIVFILFGLIDMGMMLFCILRGFNYGSNFNFVAVICGIFLYRGNLFVARLAAWQNAFFAGAFLGVLLVAPLFIPTDLLSACFRHRPLDAVLMSLYSCLLIWFVYWTQWRLAVPPVKEAYAKFPPRPFWKSFFSLGGAVVGITVGILVVAFLRGRIAADAVKQAREKTGPGYSYFVSYVGWYGKNDYHARVIAYNDDEFQQLNVYGVSDDKDIDGFK
jgi:hypothetical protein